MDESDDSKKREEEKKRKFEELLEHALKALLKKIAEMLFPDKNPVETLAGSVPQGAIQRQDMAKGLAGKLSCAQLDELVEFAEHRMEQNELGTNSYNVWKHIRDILDAVRKSKGCS